MKSPLTNIYQAEVVARAVCAKTSLFKTGQCQQNLYLLPNKRIFSYLLLLKTNTTLSNKPSNSERGQLSIINRMDICGST